LTGLCPDIGHQLLLHKKPADFAAALQDAKDIEYALEFDGSEDSINTIGHSKRNASEISDNASLHQTLETLTK